MKADALNSQSILLDWEKKLGVTTTCFMVARVKGVRIMLPKRQLSEEIKKQGIVVERTTHHLRMKINKMEAEYKRTLIKVGRLLTLFISVAHSTWNPLWLTNLKRILWYCLRSVLMLLMVEIISMHKMSAHCDNP